MEILIFGALLVMLCIGVAAVVGMLLAICAAIWSTGKTVLKALGFSRSRQRGAK